MPSRMGCQLQRRGSYAQYSYAETPYRQCRLARGKWRQSSRFDQPGPDLRAVSDRSVGAVAEGAGTVSGEAYSGGFGKLHALTHAHADLQQVCRLEKEICDDT